TGARGARRKAVAGLALHLDQHLGLESPRLRVLDRRAGELHAGARLLATEVDVHPRAGRLHTHQPVEQAWGALLGEGGPGLDHVPTVEVQDLKAAADGAGDDGDAALIIFGILEPAPDLGPGRLPLLEVLPRPPAAPRCLVPDLQHLERGSLGSVP